MELRSYWTDFRKIWYKSIFRKHVEKIEVSLKYENKGYFRWKIMYINDNTGQQNFIDFMLLR